MTEYRRRSNVLFCNTMMSQSFAFQFPEFPPQTVPRTIFGGKWPTAQCRRMARAEDHSSVRRSLGGTKQFAMDKCGDEALSECLQGSESLEEFNSCCEAVQELSSYLSEDLDTLATKHGLDVEGFLFGDQEEDSSCLSKYSLWNSDSEEPASTSHIDNSPITDGIADLDAYDAITADVFAASPSSPPQPSPPRSTPLIKPTPTCVEDSQPAVRTRQVLSAPLMETATPPMPSPARTTPFLQPRNQRGGSVKRLCPPRAPGLSSVPLSVPTAPAGRVLPQPLAVGSTFKPSVPSTPSPAKTTPFLRLGKSERRRLRPPSVHMSPKPSLLPAPVPLAELEKSAKKEASLPRIATQPAGAATVNRQASLCTTPLRPKMPSPPRTIGFLPPVAERTRLKKPAAFGSPATGSRAEPTTPVVAHTPMAGQLDENRAVSNGYAPFTPGASGTKAEESTPLGGMTPIFLA